MSDTDSYLTSPVLRVTERMSTEEWNSTCVSNCSEHGECWNGICVCEVQYEGSICQVPNMRYYLAFSSIFFVLALTSLFQLLLCVRAEFRRMKAPTLIKACRVTTQKALYVLIFIAATLRGAYFASPDHATRLMGNNLLSAYYPVLLSGCSLLVCFWAEVFHLSDIRWDRPRFLSKSFLGFIAFNVITYSILMSEVAVTHSSMEEDRKSFFIHLFNGCYGVLLFIVVIFFLIYGVEVYFKVRGEFVREYEQMATAIVINSRTVHSNDNQSQEEPVIEELMPHDKIRGGFICGMEKTTDAAQLSQSRLGLVSQAIMLLITVCFLFTDTLSGFWKYKVAIISRNCHDVIFRVVELGVALWFPCVLWNCMKPEQLWILNPKKILRKLELEIPESFGRDNVKAEDDADSTKDGGKECWICYDVDRVDAGPLIMPCQCKGDVATVHHECLRKWLMECSDRQETQCCKVCDTPYEVERGQAWLTQGFTATHWLHTCIIVTCMCVSAAGAWAVIQVFEDPGIRMLAVGIAVLVQYVSLRFLGFNFMSAYRRAKVSAFRILSRQFNLQSASQPINTISETVTVGIHHSGVPDPPETQI